MNAHVTISVVIPAYNTEDWIDATLLSVLGQTFVDFEVVVVDNGSTDRTGAIISARAASDSRIRLIRCEKNIGPSGARNLAIDAARGDWIALLDSDDRFLPNRLEALVRAAAESGAEIVADNQHLVSEQGEPLGLMWPEIDAPTLFDSERFVLRNLWGARNPYALANAKPLILRRLLTESQIRFRSDLRLMEDYHFLLALMRRGHSMLVVPQAMYCYTLRAHSLTRSNLDEKDLDAVVHAGRELLAATASPSLRTSLLLQQKSVELRQTRSHFISALRSFRVLQAMMILMRQPQAAPLIASHLLGSVALRLKSGN